MLHYIDVFHNNNQWPSFHLQLPLSSVFSGCQNRCMSLLQALFYFRSVLFSSLFRQVHSFYRHGLMQYRLLSVSSGGRYILPDPVPSVHTGKWSFLFFHWIRYRSLHSPASHWHRSCPDYLRMLLRPHLHRFHRLLQSTIRLSYGFHWSLYGNHWSWYCLTMQHYNRCRNGMFYRYTVCCFYRYCWSVFRYNSLLLFL